ncbi:response regulator transcription factor, partial [Pseudomonas aeruginosa]
VHRVETVQSDDLDEALKKASRPNRVHRAALTRPPDSGGSVPRSHFSARTRKGIEHIPPEEVIFIIAPHKSVTLRHAQGEVVLD